MLDYETLIANPETAPFQYLHAGSTDHENYQFEHVPIPESEDHATQDDALERMLERYISPALDFFDAFLAGVADPGSVPRVRWHLPHLGWQESPSWPPPTASSCGCISPRPSAPSRTKPAGRSCPSRASAPRPSWVHDPGDLVPSTLVNPFAALYEYPDERAIESRPDVLTFTTRGWDEPVTLTGRVVAHLELTSDAPSLFLHVKLVDVHPDGRAHTLLFGQIVHEPRPGATGRGLPRPHGLPRRAGTPPAPARRLERLPGLPPPPRHGRESVGRDDDAHEPPHARRRRRRRRRTSA